MQDPPEKIDSKFRFVLLSAHRAEQMMRGAQPRTDADGRKLTSVAMDEIMQDLVSWGYGPEVVPEEDDLGGEALGESEEPVSSAAEPDDAS